MGKVCKKCGIEKEEDCFRKQGKYIRNECKDCEQLYNLKRKAKNKERDKILQKTWRENNKDKRRQAKKEWTARNSEWIKEYSKSYYILNAEIERAKDKIYRTGNKIILAKAAEWRKLNRQHLLDYQKQKNKLDCDQLNARYVLDKMMKCYKVNRKWLKENPELIEIYKQILKIKRLCKTKNQP